MNYDFDDLARAIANGISRRDALKRMGTGLAGLLLSSMGIRRVAAAAVTCGACQVCDLDTNTCGLPCTPASAGSSLCTKVSQDGSYLRLVNYLISKGFQSAGPADTVLFYQAGLPSGSGLSTNFASMSVPGVSANILYAVSSNEDLVIFAVVSQNDVPAYALNIDPSGRVIQSVFNQGISSDSASVQSGSAIKENAVKPLVNLQSLCNDLSTIICGYVATGFINCALKASVICAVASGPEEEAPLPFCEFIVINLCRAKNFATCKALAAATCTCGPNYACNDPAYPGCCPPCMDCVDNMKCTPRQKCSDAAPGIRCCVDQCCNNICCAEGQTCVNGVCTSPNPGCTGATCETFVPCSTNPDCVCGSVEEGGGLCVPGSTQCATLTTCVNTGDCAAGSLCLIQTCCGVGVCVPTSLTCPPQATTNARSNAAQKAATGPTIGHR